MNEVSMRARDDGPVSWKDLKQELTDVAQALAVLSLGLPPERVTALRAIFASQMANPENTLTVFAQLVMFWVHPRAAGPADAD